jgi:tetratricopeptide (TPR) repeat protein
LAFVYLGKRNYNKAIELYQKSNALISNNAYVWLHLGNAYYFSHQYENAKKALEVSINLNPDNCFNRELMARTLLELNVPIENVIPHLNIYLQHQKLHHKKITKNRTEFYLWAKETVDNYNKSDS